MSAERSGVQIAMWVIGVLGLGAVMATMVLVRPTAAVAPKSNKSALEKELARSRREVEELTQEKERLEARVESLEVSVADARRIAQTAPTTVTAPISAPPPSRASDEDEEEEGFPAGAAWPRSAAQGPRVVGGDRGSEVAEGRPASNGARGPRPGGRLDQLVTSANLDAAQEEAVQNALHQEHMRAKAMVDQARASGGDVRQAKRQAREQTNAELKGVLSGDQYEQFSQMRQRQSGGSSGRARGGRRH